MFILILNAAIVFTLFTKDENIINSQSRRGVRFPEWGVKFPDFAV
jgi:hypothetical protein